MLHHLKSSPINLPLREANVVLQSDNNSKYSYVSRVRACNTTEPMRRVLLLLKRSAYDLYVKHQKDTALHQTAGNINDRHLIHEATISKCKDVLENLSLNWKLMFRDELREPIKNYDLIVTVGGDGTLIEASHFLDNSIPVLGVNSDPTQLSEVEEKLEEFDATRSAGYLCAATKDTFEKVLEDVLEGHRSPSNVTRISTHINGSKLSKYALNDVLIAHPSPAAVTRCSFRICKRLTGEYASPFVHTRSSGLRVCTGAGSTAAMRSAGGYIMSPTSTDLQYMVREPMTPHPLHKPFIHKCIKEDEMLHVRYGGRQGTIYIDGSYIFFQVGFGDVIELSIEAPQLQIFLKNRVS